MNTKKYLHDRQNLISEAESILRTSDENERYLLRVRAVLDVLNGGSKTVIAREANCSVKTLENWVSWVDDDKKGFQYLRFENYGRKPKFTKEQRNEIHKIITTTYPFEYPGFNTVYWSGAILAEVLSKKYPENTVSPRKCREYLKEADYSKLYEFPLLTLRRALRDANIDTACKLAELYRSGETQRNITNELDATIRSIEAERFEHEHDDDDDDDDWYGF